MAPKAKQSKPAGPELARGIGREGRSKTYKRRGLWAIKKKNGGKFPVHEKKQKAAEPEGKVWARDCTLKHRWQQRSFLAFISSCIPAPGQCLDATMA